MPSKDFMLDGDLAVTIYKRKGNRSLRLSISPSGQIRVSIPAWAPYRTGVNFAASRQAWIRSQQPELTTLRDGQAIGKAHHLEFVPDPNQAKPTSRIGIISVNIRYPAQLEITAPAVQKVAREACVRALRKQAEQLLPQRLSRLATIYHFDYGSVSIKKLKGRWGSCDQHKNIVFNLYLMQLPWELIDYVILHELTHTVILRHGPDFWHHLNGVLPDYKQHRKTIRRYQPVMSGMS